MERKKNRSGGRRRMKKRNGTSTAESGFPNTIFIPEEIIIEILSRLPLDSLARFTLVSKQWRSLISDISVAKTGPPIVLVLSDSGARAYSFSPHSIDEHQQEVLHTKSVRVPWNMNAFVNTNRYKIRLLGSCKGLLLMHAGEDLFLWNPLVRFFKKVLAFDRLLDENYRVRSGLCYDSTSDEYKTVLALAHDIPSYGGEFVVVGSLRGKSWTAIHFPYRIRTVNSGPIVNENLHWYASKNDSSNYFFSPHLIIYFDARMDKFEEVPMPNPKGEDGDIICGLGALDGCLCMFRCNGENSVELLVMKEYGVQNSWTSIIAVSDCLTSSRYYEELAQLGYTKNGEILNCGWDSYCRHIIKAFNRIDNSHRRISTPKDRFYVNAYEESLITPTDYNWEEEVQRREATYVEHIYLSQEKKMNKYGYWTTEYI